MHVHFVNAIALKSVIAIGLVGALAGCDNEKVEPIKEPPGVTLILTGSDLVPDGTISAQGMQKLQEKSGEPALNVNFLRSHLTDAGLIQLAKFKNVRLVNATGSRITEKGIEQMKKSVPEATVNK